MTVAAFAVAVFAALVGSGSLGWQIISWKQARRIDVVVTVSHDTETQPGGQGSVHVLHVRALNRGERAVEMTDVSIMRVGLEGTVFMTPPVPGFSTTIPGTVESLHTGHHYFDWFSMYGAWQPGQHIVAVVDVAAHGPVRSEPMLVR